MVAGPQPGEREEGEEGVIWRFEFQWCPGAGYSSALPRSFYVYLCISVSLTRHIYNGESMWWTAALRVFFVLISTSGWFACMHGTAREIPLCGSEMSQDIRIKRHKVE